MKGVPRMNARILTCLIALSAPVAALAAPEPGFTEKVKSRYCEKLREGPNEFAQFVRANRLVHGYTYSDFAGTSQQERPTYDCSTLRPVDRDARSQAPTKKG